MLALLRVVSTSLPVRSALAEHRPRPRRGMNLLLVFTDVGGDLAEGFEIDRPVCLSPADPRSSGTQPEHASARSTGPASDEAISGAVAVQLCVRVGARRIAN